MESIFLAASVAVEAFKTSPMLAPFPPFRVEASASDTRRRRSRTERPDRKPPEGLGEERFHTMKTGHPRGVGMVSVSF